MSNILRCDKCRWMYELDECKSCTSQSSLYRGLINEDDSLIDYEKCMDFTPLAEFEDEELEKSLEDNHSEVMYFE